MLPKDFPRMLIGPKPGYDFGARASCLGSTLFQEQHHDANI